VVSKNKKGFYCSSRRQVTANKKISFLNVEADFLFAGRMPQQWNSSMVKNCAHFPAERPRTQDDSGIFAWALGFALYMKVLTVSPRRPMHIILALVQDAF
jgi:hypothetical protein